MSLAGRRRPASPTWCGSCCAGRTTSGPSTGPSSRRPSACLLLVVVVAWAAADAPEPDWRESLLVCWVVVPFFCLHSVAGEGLPVPASRPPPAWPCWPPGGDRGLAERLPRAGPDPWRLGRLGASASAAAGVAGRGRGPCRWPCPPWCGHHRADRSPSWPGPAACRAAASWAAGWTRNTPVGSVIMTIGPSMANIVQFYGHRDAFGLSVSPNPLHRNPSYEPIVNPDRRAARGGDPVRRLGRVLRRALAALLRPPAGAGPPLPRPRRAHRVRAGHRRAGPRSARAGDRRLRGAAVTAASALRSWPRHRWLAAMA